ncbi:MAG: hypothetical protein KGN34_11875 [Sphingomonadales bacterium]|nr:hypothetical protein [Sphingomonadales bacterium]
MPHPAFTRAQRCALLAAFAALLLLRLPQAWLHGRFQNEEAAVFLAYAWHHPPAEALLRVFGGYLNLAANGLTVMLAGLLRHGLIPLEQAPRVTMIAATLVQLLPAALLLRGRARWLESRLAVVASLLVLAISPMTEEVFANVLHIQYHLALAAALVLALDPPATRTGRAVFLAPLLLGPLCGPGAIVFLPLFALRTAVDRDPARLVQTLVLGAAAALQLLLFYTPSPLRGHLLDPATLANLMLVRLAVLPLLSDPVSESFGATVHAARLAGGAVWWGLAALSCLWFGGLLWLAARRRDAALWLVLAGLAIAVVTFGIGMLPMAPAQWFSAQSAERYHFLPVTLLGLGLIALATRESAGAPAVTRPLCLLAMLSGALTYARPVADFATGPDWSSEAAAWQRDHARPLASWPAKWQVDLSDKAGACAPRGAVAPHDPQYCESHWLALVRRDAAAAAAQQ